MRKLCEKEVLDCWWKRRSRFLFGLLVTSAFCTSAVADADTCREVAGSLICGAGATSNDRQEVVLGQNAKANGEQSIAIGGVSDTQANNGRNTWAEGEQSIAIGANSHSEGDSSIAIGGDDLDGVANSDGVPYWDHSVNNDAFNNTDGPNNTNKYGKRPLSSDEFWNDMNGKFDKFSMPKHIAKKVIRMHRKRGDKILYITARPKSKNEILTSILSKIFKTNTKVIFAGYTPKDHYIKKHNIKIYYGDSDSDIQAAIDANIRGIRIIRSKSSNNPGKNVPGIFGEAVIKDSQY